LSEPNYKELVRILRYCAILMLWMKSGFIL